MKKNKQIPLLFLCLFFISYAVQAGENIKSELLYVIDGDTAKFKHSICRFAYIDTPEKKNNAKSRKESAKYNIPLDKMYDAGRMATRYTKSLLRKGRTYSIQITGKDRYDRSICVIYLDNHKAVNDMLVENGFAKPFWRYIPLSKKNKFKALSIRAKNNKKGLWRIYPTLMEKMSH